MQAQSYRPGLGPPHGHPYPRRDGLEGAWMRHDRTPGRDDDDFMVPVDPAIGAVVSAATNRTRNGWYPATKQDRNLRITAGVVGAILGLVGGIVAEAVVSTIAARLGFFVLPGWEVLVRLAFCAAGAFCGALALVALVWLGRWPRSTFVGKQGLMRFERRFFTPKIEVLRFDDASELKVQRTRRFVNGAYAGTFYDYAWHGPNGNVLFRIFGQYRDDVTPDSTDPVHFALAAESAWSAHRIQHFDRMVAEQGIARFQCGRDWIGIGRGFLELGVGGRTKRIRIEDAQSIHLEQGVLVIEEKGARHGILRSEGVHRFPIAALNDFQVFVVVLEEQTGVRLR